jgi:hypothetical protein
LVTFLSYAPTKNTPSSFGTPRTALTQYIIFVGNLSPAFGFAYKCSNPGSAGGWFSLCSYINYGKVSWKNTLLPLFTENIEISPSIEVVIID